MELIVYDYLFNQTTSNDIKEITRKMFNLGRYIVFEEELTKMYGDRNPVFTVKDRMACLIQTKLVTKYVF